MGHQDVGDPAAQRSARTHPAACIADAYAAANPRRFRGCGMKLISVSTDSLVVSAELSRSRSSKVFEDHMRASIEEMGLAEPLKVALMPSGKYLVIDGVIRLRAIHKIRSRDTTAFPEVPAYIVDYAQRFEIRYQTDIYQDLLPSQLANLVEHLHQAENVRKVDIARYIGVSPATL